LTLTNNTLVGDGTGRLTGEGVIVAPMDFNIVNSSLVIQGDLTNTQNLSVTDQGNLGMVHFELISILTN
jgi:hypothetical protein